MKKRASKISWKLILLIFIVIFVFKNRNQNTSSVGITYNYYDTEGNLIGRESIVNNIPNVAFIAVNTTVRNTGDVPLTSVGISGSYPPALRGAYMSVPSIPSLAPGASASFMSDLIAASQFENQNVNISVTITGYYNTGEGEERTVTYSGSTILSVRPDVKPDYRNAYLISWGGTACDNVNYAKSMGYDYIGYQTGMESCANAKNLRFVIVDPDQSFGMYDALSMWELTLTRTYTQAQIDSYNNFTLWKDTNQTFPYNVATGWYFSDISFRPIPDYQRQEIIDEMVKHIKNLALSKERPANNFTLGGYAWDVPSLESDLWSKRQVNGGSQIYVSYWTGNCSGIHHPGKTYEYACHHDGRAAFYKKLASETRTARPDIKMYGEPYNPYDSWVKDIIGRTDCNTLMPDLMLEEGRDTQFITDSRIFICGMNKSKVGYTAVDVKTNRIPTYLMLSSTAAINGAWAGLVGRLADSSFDYKYDVRLFPNVDKLYKVYPNWDNLYSIPLDNRTWDATANVYKSGNSYADLHIVYSRHPKNYNIYAVFIDGTSQPIILNRGETYKAAYTVTNLFEKGTRSDSDFVQNGNILTLTKTVAADTGYIIEVR